MSGPHSLDCATRGGPGVASGPCDCGAEREAAGKPELRVVPLYEQNLRDVAGQLRRVAQNIDDGLVNGRSAVLVVELGQGEVDLWSWGDTDNWRTCGMLMQAATIISTGEMPIHDEPPGPPGGAA